MVRTPDFGSGNRSSKLFRVDNALMAEWSIAEDCKFSLFGVRWFESISMQTAQRRVKVTQQSHKLFRVKKPYACSSHAAANTECGTLVVHKFWELDQGSSILSIPNKMGLVMVSPKLKAYNGRFSTRVRFSIGPIKNPNLHFEEKYSVGMFRPS